MKFIIVLLFLICTLCTYSQKLPKETKKDSTGKFTMTIDSIGLALFLQFIDSQFDSKKMQKEYIESLNIKPVRVPAAPPANKPKQ